MSNFRMERAFRRVDGSIDGFDPNQGINPEDFANAVFADQRFFDRPPLSTFVFAPFDRPRWFPAPESLQVVRARLAELAKQSDDGGQTLCRDVEVLTAVENRLDRIDTHDLKFYFLARDGVGKRPDQGTESRPQESASPKES